MPHNTGLEFDLGYTTDWRNFTKLDSMEEPGLTEVDFVGLFVQCDRCKLIMTRQVFIELEHQCIQRTEDDFVLTDAE